MGAMRLGVTLALALALGCGGAKVKSPAAPDLANPDAFARELWRIAHHGNVADWAQHLSPRLVARGGDYAASHFETWRKDLLTFERQMLGGDLAKARFELRGTRIHVLFGAQSAPLLRVMRVQGALRIDEN